MLQYVTSKLELQYFKCNICSNMLHKICILICYMQFIVQYFTCNLNYNTSHGIQFIMFITII